eukprot:1151117-Pelagomonas_calceolata.AAC.3
MQQSHRQPVHLGRKEMPQACVHMLARVNVKVDARRHCGILEGAVCIQRTRKGARRDCMPLPSQLASMYPGINQAHWQRGRGITLTPPGVPSHECLRVRSASGLLAPSRHLAWVCGKAQRQLDGLIEGKEGAGSPGQLLMRGIQGVALFCIFLYRAATLVATCGDPQKLEQPCSIESAAEEAHIKKIAHDLSISTSHKI